MSWVEQLPDESLPHVLGDLTGSLDGESFVLHLADSLAKLSLRSLTAGGAQCDLEALLVIDESREVELGRVVQLRAAVGGGRAPPRPLRNPATRRARRHLPGDRLVPRALGPTVGEGAEVCLT